MTAYYNENDDFAASWLEELIKAKLIAPGVVDRRSIVDVRPSELLEFTQCHFFAGIGVWSYALRLAGWPDDRPIWTGSCPCQPFSGAGQGGGFDDERHLWPHFHWLIENCGPAIVVGEQVASKDGLAWLDLVQADLENSNYTSGAIDTCSAGVGAPHQRQRLYWMAYASGALSEWWGIQRSRKSYEESDGSTCERSSGFCTIDNMVHAERARLEGFRGHGDNLDQSRWVGAQSDRPASATGAFDGMVDSDGRDTGAQRKQRSGEYGLVEANGSSSGLVQSLDGDMEHSAAGPLNGFWRTADWLFCRDERWRAVEPGTFPLADGVAGRVGLLRGYGNAINAYQAKVFLEAVDEILDELA